MRSLRVGALTLALLISIGLVGSALAVPPTFSVTFSPPSPVEATSADGANVVYDWTSPDNPLPVVVCQILPGGAFWSARTARLFPIGTTSVSCTASNGPVSVAEQTTRRFSIVVRDTTAPAWSGPAPLQIAAVATSPSGIAVDYQLPAATDPGNVSPPVSVSCTPAPSSVTGVVFPVGTTPVTCTASDARGNTTAANEALAFDVIVTLSGGAPTPGPPTMILPAEVVAEATSARGAVVRYDVSTSSASPASIFCDPPPGALFPLGTTMVTCAATSPSSGEQTVQSFPVTVRDSTAPAFAARPAGIVKKVKKRVRVPISYRSPLATDIVDGTVPSVCRPRSGSKFKLGRSRIACTATDSHGNARTLSFGVRIIQIGPLVAPAEGARLASPPLLRWKPVKKASYYNVQLWRGNRKILSTWPQSRRLRLHRNWTFAGAERRLTPGLYTWYVWPGYGRKAAADYGKLIGKRTFRIVAR